MWDLNLTTPLNYNQNPTKITNTVDRNTISLLVFVIIQWSSKVTKVVGIVSFLV